MDYPKHGEFKVIRFNNILIISLKGNFNREGIEEMLETLRDKRDELNKQPFIQIMTVDDWALATQEAVKSAFSKAPDKDGFDPRIAILITKSSIVKRLIDQFQNRQGGRTYPHFSCNEINEAMTILESGNYLNHEEISSLRKKLKEI